MSDYAADISTDDYIYTREISITETGGEDRTNFQIKLSLDSSNFNFELARSDGKDFRMGEGSNGTYMFNMWVAAWDTTYRVATIWFKIHSLLANETKTLYVFWGNSSDSGISDIDSVGFPFADGFDGTSIDTTKWGYSDIQDVADSKLRIKTDGYITSSGVPLSGITNWIVEDGIYLDAALTATDKAYYRYRFYGTENDFGWNFYGEGDYDRRSNLVNGSTWVYYNGTEKGLEGQSYSENSIGYNESDDKVYQSMAKRNTYADYTDSWERQVYGDTRVTYFRIYGRNDDTAPWIYIDWVIVREYFEVDPYSFNTSNLFVTWEQINHQTIDYIEYDADLTDTNYYHSSSYGGDPYRLSDDATGSTTDCWYSDSNTVVSGIDLIIDFGRHSTNLVSSDYIHYDSGHVGWKNASKLSDNDLDPWGNDYFQGTTTSGYMCIDFGDDNVAVGCLLVKVHTTASGMVRNFIFKGSYSDPRISTDDEWDTLYTGEFANIADWQPIYIVNGKPYRYYKLEVIDTYSFTPVTMQEWEMYEYFPARRKMVISQLRLRPITLGSDEVYFPKQINLQGSNELNDWDTIVPITNTYTPFEDYVWERWQRYSFTNTKGYYRYRVTCSGNWNNHVGRMGISEWEIRERVDEIHSHRVVGGSSSNFNSVWSDDNTTFDGGFIYISNDNINVIYDNLLSSSTSVSGTIMDINVI